MRKNYTIRIAIIWLAAVLLCFGLPGVSLAATTPGCLSISVQSNAPTNWLIGGPQTDAKFIDSPGYPQLVTQATVTKDSSGNSLPAGSYGIQLPATLGTGTNPSVNGKAGTTGSVSCSAGQSATFTVSYVTPPPPLPPPPTGPTSTPPAPLPNPTSTAPGCTSISVQSNVPTAWLMGGPQTDGKFIDSPNYPQLVNSAVITKDSSGNPLPRGTYSIQLPATAGTATNPSVNGTSGTTGSVFCHENQSITFAVAYTQPPSGPPTSTPTNHVPVGYHDTLSCTIVQGWACDPDSVTSPLSVLFYINKPFDQGGVLVGSVTADTPRAAGVAAACGGNPNHGFSAPTPSELRDGSHSLYVYAVDAETGAKTLLGTSPKSVTCTIVPPTPAPKSGGTPPPASGLTYNLSLGSHGVVVAVLQKLLVQEGYLKSAPTGFFDATTQAAVKAFQQAKGLQVTGSLTINASALASVVPPFRAIGPGAPASDVTDIQKFLIVHGYLNIRIPNGLFDPATQAAVKAFQKAHNLPQAGTVDQATFNAMNGR